MPILDAALAFAITMFVMASVVSQLLDWAYSFAGLRKKDLRKMLGQFADDELAPVVKREMERVTGKVDAKVADGISAVAKKLKLEHLFSDRELAGAVELSTQDVVERLKRSDLGKEALEKMGDEAESIFSELGARYEAVGSQFTRSFRQRSKLWAFGVSVAVALAANVDSIRLIDQYMRNASLSASVAAQVDVLMERTTSTATQSVEAGGTEAVRKQYQAVTNQLASVSKQVDTLGVPIGGSYFPYSKESRAGLKGWALGYRLLGWLAGILLTGVLAGLGAPFWYDTLTGISSLARQIRPQQSSGGQVGTSVVEPPKQG